MLFRNNALLCMVLKNFIKNRFRQYYSNGIDRSCLLSCVDAEETTSQDH
jgi:hypothetical protein